MKRYLLAVLTCLVATAPVVAQSRREAPALTIEQLLEKFRQVPGLEAKFREEKRMEMLAAPLVSEGTLHFMPPGRLARKTTKPNRTVMLIDGARLSFNDGQTTEVMSLDSNPVAKLFVDSFLKILVGDTAALNKLYAISFKPAGGEKWELRLKPKVEPMSSVIDAIELSGVGVLIERMRIVEVGGDETVTTYSAINAARAFSPDEQKKIFALTSP